MNPMQDELFVALIDAGDAMADAIEHLSPDGEKLAKDWDRALDIFTGLKIV